MKTNELTGAALDWAVAKCEGLNPDESGLVEIGTFKGRAASVPIFYAPSQNWAQGGPIIEREEINLWTEGYTAWEATSGGCQEWGSTPLIAAMRCYVASKLGDEVDVPEELMEV